MNGRQDRGVITLNPFIPKLAMLTLSLHCEHLNSNQPEKCECVVEFLLFYKKRHCTGRFGIWSFFPENLVNTPVADLYSKILNVCPLSGSKFLHFHAVFGKF